ncbi:MAG: 4-alpha-glucanotransferase [Cyclobacteriaceae bacterium]
MKITFEIGYRTHWGQALYVCGSDRALGGWDENKALKLRPGVGELWTGFVNVKKADFTYKYFLRDENTGWMVWEEGVDRHLNINKNSFTGCFVKDNWRPENSVESILTTSPFMKAFFNREAKAYKTKYTKTGNYVRFQIRAPRVSADYSLGLIGSTKTLGAWDESNVLLMSDEDFPVWKVDVKLTEKELPLEYKYVIYSHQEQRIVTWESRDNRYFPLKNLSNDELTIWTDESFEYPVGCWKAAGVAIPVFSLRSKNGTGVGEFTDINILTDWSVKTGMKLIQILPVNDTTASHTWVDSYPYAAISVQALHPIYASLQAVGRLKDNKLEEEIEKRRAELNELEELDYEAVMQIKSRFFKASYEENKKSFLASSSYKSFFKDNQHWLIDYAVFSMMRDRYGTPDFTLWKELSTYDEKKVVAFADPKHKDFDNVAIHFYIQYHLDKQLIEASQYARNKGVVLKGDIPIGIYRNSVDAWTEPHLYNMDCQAGAPPDDFSISGQNWGFPTYNWEEMANDGFRWWKNRLIKMSEYFDVFRIDHILGFFRIWEIPNEHVEGLLGRFNPALPIGFEEFSTRGIYFDLDRFTKPYIRTHIVQNVFNNHADRVFQNYLHEYAPGCWEFKPDYDTQRKVKEFFDREISGNTHNKDFLNWLRFGLYRLHADVLFLEAPLSNGQAFNPRIAMHSTFSYQELDDHTQQKMDDLYNHYFYHRHNDFWRESAMRKLPSLKAATNMLICGEDLGMVPACVPGVMDELSILSLAIQRMPNDDREFWHPTDTLTMSVTSTGSHDMSTLREWWQEDAESTQRFYNSIMCQHDRAPYFCEPWVAKNIISQHLHSPSIWAIFPIQDLLAMDGVLRREKPENERINVPANPQHYWRYRLHISIEELLSSDLFNGILRQMIDQGGRSSAY